MTARFCHRRLLAPATARTLFLAIAIAAAAVLASCGKQGGPVALSNEWPSEVRSYETVTRNWTRTATLLRDYDKVLEVHATFKSPEWRTAWVERRIKREQLPASERAPLLDAQKNEDSKHYEVELLVTTYDSTENDLQKGANSIWRVSLVDDAGREVIPFEIKRDRRPKRAIRGDFPVFGDFASAYRVRFPKTLQVLGHGSKEFAVKMSSASGVAEMVWREH